MGIQGALYSGVSGLNSNSTSMEVIGNNIANSNTYGYKTSRAVFADALSNAVASSSGSAQLGSGSRLSTVDSVFGQGTFESTSSSTDLAIQGDAFFIVKDLDSGTENYTRAGAFRIQDGKLTNPEGLVVQGYEAGSKNTLTEIEFSIGDDYPGWEASTTEEAEELRLAADALALFESTAVEVAEGAADASAAAKAVGDIDDIPEALVTAANTAADLKNATAESVADAVSAAVDAAETAASKAEDGLQTSAPTLESVKVDSDGVITGVYTDGSTAELYTIGVATFSNPSGLTKEGNSLYSASEASGAADVKTISASGGDIYSSSLEMSNVDLSQEFVSMITTQRGFQASSKIITTTDELLNEVINLKR